MEASIERDYSCQNKQDEVHTASFVIETPKFPDDEQYDFIWDKIKTKPDPVQKYSFI